MPSSERLTAYLAEELSPDERRALEADLAADPRLRGELAAMRRADAALSGVAPTALPDGARDRLLSALGASFDDELGGSAASDPFPGDELAERRRRSVSRRTWLTAAGGAAAAVLAVAVALPNLGIIGSGADEDAMDSGAATMSAENAEDDAAGAMSTQLAGPVLTGGDREIDAGLADELLASPELEDVASRGLTPEEAATLGTDWALALGATGGSGADGATGLEAPDEPSDDDVQLEEAPADAGPADVSRATAELRVGSEVDDTGRADVARCLDTLLATGDLAIPVTAELVTFDGEPAIAFGLVGRDADGEVARREVWVLARDGCERALLRPALSVSGGGPRSTRRTSPPARRGATSRPPRCPLRRARPPPSRRRMPSRAPG